MDAALLHELQTKYGIEKVDQAINYLSYKNPTTLFKEESHTIPTLYVFRHGQTEDNANFIFSGWRDSPLTQKGIEQAYVLAEKMKDKKLDMLIASTLTRAIDTMKIAVSKNEKAKNLEIYTDARIKERSYGDLMGKSKLVMQLEDPELLLKDRRDFTYCPPNGESIEMVCKRVAQFCDEILPLMRKFKINVAISCHGNSIRGFKRYFEKLSDEETATTETPLAQDYAAYLVRD